nr:uncharacterized protein LOC127301442 [Lolium perenne]
MPVPEVAGAGLAAARARCRLPASPSLRPRRPRRGAPARRPRRRACGPDPAFAALCGSPSGLQLAPSGHGGGGISPIRSRGRLRGPVSSAGGAGRRRTWAQDGSAWRACQRGGAVVLLCDEVAGLAEARGMLRSGPIWASAGPCPGLAVGGRSVAGPMLRRVLGVWWTATRFSVRLTTPAAKANLGLTSALSLQAKVSHHWCRCWRCPWVPFPLLRASSRSLVSYYHKLLRSSGENLCSSERAAATHCVVTFLKAPLLESVFLVVR